MAKIYTNFSDKEIFGIGAAAKANTFLTYLGLDSTILRGITDSSPHKIGKYTPLTRIPIVEDQALSEYEKKAKAAWKLPPIFDDQCKTSISQNKERLEHLPRYEITHTFKTDAGSVVVSIKTAGMNSKVTIDAGKNPMIAQAAILELEKLLTFSTLATRTNQA